ncbi:HNH/endonuclease VII fold putative polymorphic toxin, partial [Streptomyces sp. NPDC058398]|uniref:HNH/endonuclease VII fold putative polymorphic toxin n=1 Tax=Streptomyces sp. NPDC058398 TaxID=3346479 RepID=UPI00364FF945
FVAKARACSASCNGGKLWMTPAAVIEAMASSAALGNSNSVSAYTGQHRGRPQNVSGKKVDCNQCFLAGTDVLMADGSTKNIEDIKLGDKVLATDPKIGTTGPRKVTRLIRTENDKHFNELSIATEDGIEKLTATYEHPFWSPSQRDWIPAGALKSGMTLRTDTGRTVIVTGNHPFAKHARTYNLTVDDLHAYYVLAGETPVLVHNSNCVPSTRTLPSRNSAFRAAKRDLGIPNGQQPDELNMVPMTDRSGNNILNPDGTRVMTREYVFTRGGGDRVIIQDHSYGHYYGEGGVGDQEAHFNVRPFENPRTGKVPGTAQHYEY